MKVTFILILSFLACSFSYSQTTEKDGVDGKIYAVQLGLGGNIPGGDMADRYGANLNFSIGGQYITQKDWFWSPELIYFYGDNIKEDILKPYRTPEGFLLGDDIQLVEMRYRQRGIYVGASVGKLIRFSDAYRSGLGISIGGGLLAHKIVFSDVRNSLAQVRAGRNIGYDRLTRGAVIKETISYKLLTKDRKLNLDFSFDFMQGFTSEVRKINFDTGLPTNGARLDLLTGFRIIWTLPYYVGEKDATVYY